MLRLAAALLLAFLPSCSSFVAQVTEGTGVAGGAAVGAVVAGPAGAAAGAILGYWGGNEAAEALTGTRKLWVPDGSGSVLPGTGWFSLGFDFTNTMIWILAIGAFIYFGGLGWLKANINKRVEEAKKEADAKLVAVKKEDDDWADDLAEARAAHQAETAALKAEVTAQKARLDMLEKLVTSGKVKP